MNTRLADKETSQRLKPLAHSSLMAQIIIGASLLPSASAVAARNHANQNNVYLAALQHLGLEIEHFATSSGCAQI